MKLAPCWIATSAVSTPAEEWPILKTILRFVHSLISGRIPGSSGAAVMILMVGGIDGEEDVRCSFP